MDCEHWIGLPVHSSYPYVRHFTMRAVEPSLIYVDFAKKKQAISQTNGYSKSDHWCNRKVRPKSRVCKMASSIMISECLQNVDNNN